MAFGPLQIWAEGEGFEPPGLSACGFQDRRIKPLCHPSMLIRQETALHVVSATEGAETCESVRTLVTTALVYAM